MLVHISWKYGAFYSEHVPSYATQVCVCWAVVSLSVAQFCWRQICRKKSSVERLYFILSPLEIIFYDSLLHILMIQTDFLLTHVPLFPLSHWRLQWGLPRTFFFPDWTTASISACLQRRAVLSLWSSLWILLDPLQHVRVVFSYWRLHNQRGGVSWE